MGRSGYVYVMRLDEHGSPDRCAHKIGKSIKPVNRHNQIATLLPYSLSLVHVRLVPDMDVTERMLHQRYEANRLEGEWFRLSNQEIADLVSVFGGTGEGCVCWDYNPPCPFFEQCNPEAF